MPQIKRPEDPVLCERCTPYLPLLVDVSPASKPGTAHTQWWNETYGKLKPWVVQGLHPDRCELCRTLHARFSKCAGFDPQNTKISSSAQQLCAYKGWSHHTCTFRACGVDLTLAPVVPTVTMDDGEVVNAFAGRPVFQAFNPLLAQIWMAKCHDQHAACRPEYTAKDFDFSFRVIDVQEGRLLEAPPDLRYVALSYVWGGVKQVMLNKSNKTFLEQTGSITAEGLSETSGEFVHVKEEVEAEGRVIPRTIREAIRLCQLINERYLWTDSLCIMQDEEIHMGNGAWTNADKLAQIPKMDIIYGASALTVVAASGADSNAGLTGIHTSPTRTGQTVGKIGDQFFVSIQHDPMEAFWKSTLATRAWTFQEFLLSRRHMIFLPEQVVFHCRTLSWCEDHPMEYIDEATTSSGNASPAWTNSWQLRPLKIPESTDFAEDVWYPGIFINQTYASWLENFLQRRLTVPSDILFAFEGALSASTRLVGSFYQGLPIDYFCEALNWGVGQAGSTLSSVQAPYHGLSKRRPGFPSWSWTGWMWDLPPSESFNLHYQTKSPTQWNRIAIWGLLNTPNNSTPNSLAPYELSTPDADKWDALNIFPPRTFTLDDTWLTTRLPTSLTIARTTAIPSSCIILKTALAPIYIDTHSLPPHSNLHRAFHSPDFSAGSFGSGIGLSSALKADIEGGVKLKIMVVGSFFRGPDVKFSESTDEGNPTVKCLVVKEVGEGLFERVGTFWARCGEMVGVAWEEAVVVLQ